MSLIVISIVIMNLVLSIVAGPVPVLPISILDQMKTDDDIKSKDLLDEQKFTFLKECNSPKNALLCKVYYDVLLAINCSQNDAYLGISKVNNTRICQKLAITVPKTSNSTKTELSVARFSNITQKKEKCELACFYLDSDGNDAVKDICKAILWGYTQIKSPKTTSPPVPKVTESKVEQPSVVKQPIITEAGSVFTPVNDKPVEKIPSKAAAPVVPEVVPTPQAERPKDEIKPPTVGATTTTEKENKIHSNVLNSNKTDSKKLENGDNKAIPKPPVANEEVSEIVLNPEEVTNDPNSVVPVSDANDHEIIMDEADIENQGNDEIGSEENGDSATNVFEHNIEKQPVEQPKDDFEIDSHPLQEEKYGFADEDSNFFTFFLFGSIFCILCYVIYHNKTKVLALLLEGRRTSNGRGGYNRRKHTAAYRKLDSNLEEAITSSNSSGQAQQIIY